MLCPKVRASALDHPAESGQARIFIIPKPWFRGRRFSQAAVIPFGDSVIRSPYGCPAPSLTARARGGIANFGRGSRGSVLSGPLVCTSFCRAAASARLRAPPCRGRGLRCALRSPAQPALPPALPGVVCALAGRGLEGSSGVSRTSPSGRTLCFAQKSVRARWAAPRRAARQESSSG